MQGEAQLGRRAASAGGASVVIVDKSIIGRGGATIMAQMTTAVALGAAEPDSTELHAEDTWIGSRALGDRAIIDVICNRGPEVIREIEGYGANWARTAQGAYSQVFAPGHSRKRCVYVDVLRTGDAVSQAIVGAVVDGYAGAEAWQIEGVLKPFRRYVLRGMDPPNR